MSKTKIDFTNDEQELTFFCGDTLLIPITFKDDLDAPVDISTWTFTAGINGALGEEVTPVSCVVPNGTDGILKLELTPTQTAALQTNGRKQPCLTWYCSVTVAGVEVTPFGGPLKLRFR